MGAIETSNRVTAAGLIVPVVAPPFVSQLQSAKGFQSFVRLGAGQYVLELDNPVSLQEAIVRVFAPPNTQVIGAGQVRADGTVFVSFLSLATGTPVDPDFFTCDVLLFNEGDGVGPTVPVPAPPPPYPGGSGVSSWNLRVGAVVPIAGDYAASQVTNDSVVGGAFVSTALDNLLAADLAFSLTDGSRAFTGEVAGITPTLAASLATKSYVDSAGAGVSSWNARTGAVLPVAGDYAASQVTNDSAVVGAFTSDALDTLLAADLAFSLTDGSRAFTGEVAGITPTLPASLATKSYVDSATAAGVTSFNARTGAVVPTSADYTTTLVANLSGVTGVTTTDALNAIGAAITALISDGLTYSKTDGSRAFTGEVAGITPTVAASLATKSYVDGATAAGVTSWNARTGAVVPVSGDYTTTLVTNASSVVGATATAAFNTIAGQITALVAEDLTFSKTNGSRAFTGEVAGITPTVAASLATKGYVDTTTGAILTSSAPVDVTKAAAVVGVGTTAARFDHKHDITTAVAVSIAPSSVNAEGVASTLARSDHTHALPAFGTASGTFMQGNDARVVAADVTGFTTGSVTFVATGALAQSNAQFFWNNATSSLGIGTATTAPGKVVIAQGTITTDLNAINITATWNNAAVTFNGFEMNITATLFNNASTFFDFQKAGASQLSLRHDGILTFTGGENTIVSTSGIFQYTAAAAANGFTFQKVANGAGNRGFMLFTQPANITQTASVEKVQFDVDLSSTIQRNTGAVTLQRQALFRAPTWAFVGASVITTAATLAVSGPPIAGTNATITTAYSLFVQSGLIKTNGISTNYTAQTTTYAILRDDFTVDCNGTFTATLPTAVGYAGQVYCVKNSGVGVITIATTGGQTINGAATLLPAAGVSVLLQSTGTNWITLSIS